MLKKSIFSKRYLSSGAQLTAFLVRVHGMISLICRIVIQHLVGMGCQMEMDHMQFWHLRCRLLHLRPVSEGLTLRLCLWRKINVKCWRYVIQVALNKIIEYSINCTPCFTFSLWITSLWLNLKLDNNDDHLQLDDLYVEILYTILHMIGCEVKQEEQVELIIHLKNAFHMDEDRHRQLLETATMREVWQMMILQCNKSYNDVYIIYIHVYLFMHLLYCGIVGAIFKSKFGHIWSTWTDWKGY